MAFLGFGFSSYGPFQGERNELLLGKNVTLIIGKNNTGKSCAVDLLCQLFGSDLGRTNAALPETVDLHYTLDEATINEFFPKATSKLIIPSIFRHEFGRQFVDKRFVVRHYYPSTLVAPVSSYNDKSLYSEQNEECWQSLASELMISFDNYKETVTIQRLMAERAILPEIASDTVRLTSRGEGASNLVQRIINQSIRDESLIEDKLLCALNEIMAPDALFESIRVQIVVRDGEEKWEIFLREEGKGRFPLSSTGSGLKTVILVLLNLLTVNQNARGDRYFCFEELENNLHPSLQRRLFQYLYRYSQDQGVKIVLTSHSSVAINVFSGLEGNRIYHAQKNQDGVNELKCVMTTDEGRDLLADLGVKASDLFQANGIIWVEGPSDRIYIKAWLEALYPGEFIEDTHYQFLYYGGKLLSHYTAEETAEKINVMFTNMNSAIVIDSDRRKEKVEEKKKKKRVRKEFNARGLFCWITEGKEIENYLSLGPLERSFGSKAPKAQVGALELFPEYIEKTYPKFKSCKVDFARVVAANIHEEDLDVLDLRKRITALRDVIEKWNS